MSRGAGRTQRQVLTTLKQRRRREISRRELEKVLVGGKDGCTESNLLRAIRGLERIRAVSLYDVADKDRAVVRLRSAGRISEERVGELLREVNTR